MIVGLGHLSIALATPVFHTAVLLCGVFIKFTLDAVESAPVIISVAPVLVMKILALASL